MNAGTLGVKTSTGAVNDSGKAFQELITQVSQLAEKVQEILNAIRLFSDGGQQIVSSVKEIKQLTKKTTGEAHMVSVATEGQTAAMEEIASSSNSLAKMAQDLQEAVSIFRI